MKRKGRKSKFYSMKKGKQERMIFYFVAGEQYQHKKGTEDPSWEEFFNWFSHWVFHQALACKSEKVNNTHVFFRQDIQNWVRYVGIFANMYRFWIDFTYWKTPTGLREYPFFPNFPFKFLYVIYRGESWWMYTGILSISVPCGRRTSKTDSNVLSATTMDTKITDFFERLTTHF